MPQSSWLIALWGLLIGLFVIAITAAAIQPDAHVPQARPFNVYETPSACVYVVGAVQPAIAVMPKYYQRDGGC